MDLFNLIQTEMKLLKDFLSVMKVTSVTFEVSSNGVEVSVSNGASIFGKLQLPCQTFLEEDAPVTVFTLRYEVLMKALSLFNEMGVVDDGGCIKIEAKGHTVNLYKVPDPVDIPEELKGFLSFNGNHVDKSRAKEIYETFSLSNTPNSYMSRTISLGERSSFMGKIHYVEAVTPEFDFKDEGEDEEVFISVESFFPKCLRSVAGLGLLGDVTKVYYSSEKDVVAISLVSSSTDAGDVKMQFLFSNLYEEPMWDVSEVKDQSTEFEFTFDAKSCELEEILDVFSIPLAGTEKKEISIAVDKEASKLHLTVYDIGGQPTISSIDIAGVTSIPGTEICNLVYQSLGDIFSRGAGGLYSVEGKGSAVIFTTDKTMDVLNKFI